MRIVIDARMYGLEHTGVGRYIMHLVEELGKLDKKNNYALLLRKKYFDSLKLPDRWDKILADFRHYSFAEQLKLPGLISTQKPDIVHFPHFNVPTFYGGRFIVTLHDMIMHKQGKNATTLPLSLYYLKRLFYKYSFRNTVNFSTSIVTPTKEIKRQIVKYYKINPTEIKVVYEGFNEDFKQKSRKGRDNNLLRKLDLEPLKYFIYVGNVYPYKNLKRAIKAIEKLNRKGNDIFKFIIVSSRNVFTKRLNEEIKALNAEKFVKFLGFVPDEELRVLLKNSLAFVYPSLSEGFGLQGLESMAAGTIVLASDTPVFREVYQDNVLYFNPRDVGSIEKSMRSATKMPARKRQELTRNAQKFIKRYSWAKMAKQTLKVYQESASYP